MKKVILGTGLLICGMLGELFYHLMFLFYRLGSQLTGIMYVLNIWHVQAIQLFSVAGALLAIWGLFEKNEKVMKRMVFGVGLLICGMLGAWSYYIGIIRFTPQQPVYYLRYFYLEVVVIMFFAIGVALNIWGLFDRVKNAMKKVVFGTGLLICGTLSILAIYVLYAISFATQVYHSLPPFIELGITLILVGIALNIWGMIEIGKKSSSAESIF